MLEFIEEERRERQKWQQFVETDYNQNPAVVSPENNKPSFVGLWLLASAGVLLSATGAVVLDDMANRQLSKIEESQDFDNENTASTPDSSAEHAEPEFEIDFTEIAIANAAMLDFRIEPVDSIGVNNVPVHGGALVNYDNGLYFATLASDVIPLKERQNDEFVVTADVPVGAGYDVLRYAIPARDFRAIDENPDIAIAQFKGRDGGSLELAISEQRIIPIFLTSLHGDTGQVVVGRAEHETPLLHKDTGKVYTQSVFQHMNHTGPMGFESDPHCKTQIQDGDFVLNTTKIGRLAAESYAIVTGVAVLDDPHNYGACLFGGIISVNAEITQN